MSPNNILHRTHRDNRFTTINVTAVEDSRLTGTAKAIHLYAMSRPEGWTLRMADITAKFHENQDTIYRAMKLLEKYGYLKREIIRGDHGKIEAWVYHWFEVPVSENQVLEKREQEPLSEKQEIEKPQMVEQELEKRDTYNIPAVVSTNVQSTSVPQPAKKPNIRARDLKGDPRRDECVNHFKARYKDRYHTHACTIPYDGWDFFGLCLEEHDVPTICKAIDAYFDDPSVKKHVFNFFKGEYGVWLSKALGKPPLKLTSSSSIKPTTEKDYFEEAL